MDKRLKGLDGLRAILATVVIAGHAYVPGFESNVAVDVFFVISGFLITGILMRELDKTGTIDVVRFLARRARKLLPPLFLLCAAVLVLWPQYRAAVWAAAALATDYHQSFSTHTSPVVHTWSLSVEEHFYLIWPLVLLALRVVRRALWLPILLTLFAVATCWCAVSYEQFGVEATYYRFDPRLSGLIAGSILALAGSDRRWVMAIVVLAATMAAFALAIGVAPTYALGSPAATTLALALIVTLQDRGIAALNHRALVWAGQRSYGIYLFHFPIVIWANTFFDWPIAFSLGLVGSIALAAVYAVAEARLSR